MKFLLEFPIKLIKTKYLVLSVRIYNAELIQKVQQGLGNLARNKEEKCKREIVVVVLVRLRDERERVVMQSEIGSYKKGAGHEGSLRCHDNVAL